MNFPGFSDRAPAVSVPEELCGPLLTQIQSQQELKTLLRFLWLQSHGPQGPGMPVAAIQLETDQQLLDAMPGQSSQPPASQVKTAIAAARTRGLLLKVHHPDHGPVYILNTPARRRRAAQWQQNQTQPSPSPTPPAQNPAEPNIYALYQDNIGPLGPHIADLLQEAADRYPPDWIAAAFDQAIQSNRLSWSYIAELLRRRASGSGPANRRTDPESDLKEPPEYGISGHRPQAGQRPGAAPPHRPRH